MTNRLTSEQHIELSERYDKESDVYYVTVKTGEPSIVMEHDDRLLIENGIFTGMPTGFRILNYSKHAEQAGGFKEVFVEVYKMNGLKRIKDLETRQKQVEKRFSQFLDKVIA